MKKAYIVVLILLLLLFSGCTFGHNEARDKFQKGYSAMQNRDYDEAMTNFNEVIKVDPGNAEAYFYRGFIYGFRDKLDKTMVDFNKAIEL